jgi:hypothetical protein
MWRLWHCHLNSGHVAAGLRCLLLHLQDALAARLGQVSEFNKQSDALKVAAGALEGAISGAAEQVRLSSEGW